MTNINFNFDNKIGKIKPMHGVGQPPSNGINSGMFHYLTEAGIPYSRLHDMGGWYGGNMFVDISNIFRDFSADENDENSYDFAFSDILIKDLYDSKCQVIYRLGESIENYHYVKAYRILPPADYKKWAVICEHIIKHYNEGWANGFNFNIQYWEIWNEPDNGRDDTENQMWHGTPEQFYELYDVTAKHLKSVFGNKIKVGGFATCGFRHIFSDPEKYGIEYEKQTKNVYCGERSANFMRFIDGFFAYIKKHNSPLDFFSWHSYLSTEKTLLCAKYAEKMLNDLGYGDVETQVNEWNNCMEDDDDYGDVERLGFKLRGTGMAAAKAAGMMCGMQNTKTQLLCYYDARCETSLYGGMFNPLTREPFQLYYSFVAFNELYKLGTQAEVEYEKEPGLYVLGAVKCKQKAAMFVNESEKDIEVSTNLSGNLSLYIIDDNKCLEKIDGDITHFTIPSGTVILVK